MKDLVLIKEPTSQKYTKRSSAATQANGVALALLAVVSLIVIPGILGNYFEAALNVFPLVTLIFGGLIFLLALFAAGFMALLAVLQFKVHAALLELTEDYTSTAARRLKPLQGAITVLALIPGVASVVIFVMNGGVETLGGAVLHILLVLFSLYHGALFYLVGEAAREVTFTRPSDLVFAKKKLTLTSARKEQAAELLSLAPAALAQHFPREADGSLSEELLAKMRLLYREGELLGFYSLGEESNVLETLFLSEALQEREEVYSFLLKDFQAIAYDTHFSATVQATGMLDNELHQALVSQAWVKRSTPAPHYYKERKVTRSSLGI